MSLTGFPGTPPTLTYAPVIDRITALHATIGALAALHHRERYGRLTVLYGARTPDDILFRDELARWAEQERVQVEVTVDSGDPSWQGHMGVVLRLIPGAQIDPLHSVAMVCGPEIMMRFTVTELEKLGMSDDRIFLSMERNMRCAVGLCGHSPDGSSEEPG